MTVILSEKFGLYQIEVEENATGFFFYDIECLNEDGSLFGEHFSTAVAYPTPYEAFRGGMIRLAVLFWQDVEAIMVIKSPSIEGDRAGNGIRTHDILLGNFSLPVKSSDGEVQS